MNNKPYKVIVWNNNGIRNEYPATCLTDAHEIAKKFRTLANKTVKTAWVGESVDHWQRNFKNHWSRKATAEYNPWAR